MKAIFVDEPFKIRIADINIPKISDDEVLLRNTGCGICGSDIGIYNGTNSLATYPRLIGHEFGGEVVEIGRNVTNVKPKDMVAVDPVRSCGKCYACSIGRHNVCSTLEVAGVHRDGGFAEYIAVPAEHVYPVDTSKVEKNLLSLVEPYSIGVQVNYRGNIMEGDKLLVMGSGPIGLTIMQVAKSRGAKVMMTDIFEERLKRAGKMGADEVVNVRNEQLKPRIYKWTNGEGASVIADTVCSPESFPEAIDLACPAGRVVVLGLISKPSSITQAAITKKELSIMGSRVSNHRFPEAIKGFENGSLTPELIRSHEVHYTEIEDAFKLIKSHTEQVCKVLVKF